MTVALSELLPGQKARIVRIGRSGGTLRRIADMVVTPGAVIEVQRVAPLGDPIEVKIRGYNLSLRKSEAAAIEVELTEEHCPRGAVRDSE